MLSNSLRAKEKNSKVNNPSKKTKSSTSGYDFVTAVGSKRVRRNVRLGM
jgi:hypothetical protein